MVPFASCGTGSPDGPGARSKKSPGDSPGSSPPAGLPACLLEASARIRDQIANYHGDQTLPGISEGVRHQLESGGKRLRPALALWIAGVLGGRPDATMPFALAVELLHNFFLVHDDIEDGDAVRRDRPTLWVKLGVPVAINVGDFLLAEAYRQLGLVKCPDLETQQALFSAFTHTFRTTVEGQALDLVGRADAEFTLARYDDVIRRKTGRYLALGLVGGALVAGHGPEEVAQLWQVGDQLGPAFQMRDDLIDLTQGKGRGGMVGCDIREGKPSFLFAYTLENNAVPDADKQKLVAVLGCPRDESSDHDVEWVIDLYRESGAIDYCQQECQRRGERAVSEFRAIPFMPQVAVDGFREITHYIVERKV